MRVWQGLYITDNVTINMIANWVFVFPGQVGIRKLYQKILLILGDLAKQNEMRGIYELELMKYQLELCNCLF